MPKRNKTVHVLAHEFDCTPSYVTVAATGFGSGLAIAVRRAVAKIMRDKHLRHKQLGSFKLSIAVIAENTDGPVVHPAEEFAKDFARSRGRDGL